MARPVRHHVSAEKVATALLRKGAFNLIETLHSQIFICYPCYGVLCIRVDFALAFHARIFLTHHHTTDLPVFFCLSLCYLELEAAGEYDYQNFIVVVVK